MNAKFKSAQILSPAGSPADQKEYFSSPTEDCFFRQLGEAYINEDETSFIDAYKNLSWLASQRGL